MKKRVKGRGNPLPEIYVSSRNQIVLGPSLPLNWYNNGNKPDIKKWYARIDEFYNTTSINVRSGPYFHLTSGVYLVEFTYTGDDRYKPTEYLYYVIIPEFDIND